MRLARRTFLPIALALLFSTCATALRAEPTANDLLSQARATAATQHKNILLIFSASWCGPCHMFEHFLADPAIAPIMNKAFVLTTLDVGEHPTDTRHHDTPGAADLRASLGGATAGYPYLIMLPPAGHPIINSLRPDPTTPGGNNIGYPAIPAEIDWFMQMLQKSAPTLTPQDTATLHAWLTAHGS
ncbi:MAG: thioredoxin family protein [Acidobacteriaceae bacterium]